MLVPGYIAAQMLGGIVGAVLVFLFYRDHYAASDDPDAKLATFATAPAIRNPLEQSCSAKSSARSCWCSPCCWRRTDRSVGATTWIRAMPGMKIGLGTLGACRSGCLVLSIGLSLGGTTGYAINPARDLGPRIAHALLPIPGKRDSDWGYAWMPVVGPLLGAAVAVLLWTQMQYVDVGSRI